MYLASSHLPAIRSINEMQKAPDFDRKMLLLATHIAHRSEMRLVLLSVLNNLLKTLKFGASGEIVVEAMTLLRCMIKLILGLLVDPTANRFVELHFQAVLPSPSENVPIARFSVSFSF